MIHEYFNGKDPSKIERRYRFNRRKLQYVREMRLHQHEYSEHILKEKLSKKKEERQNVYSEAKKAMTQR